MPLIKSTGHEPLYRARYGPKLAQGHAEYHCNDALETYDMAQHNYTQPYLAAFAFIQSLLA